MNPDAGWDQPLVHLDQPLGYPQPGHRCAWCGRQGRGGYTLIHVNQSVLYGVCEYGMYNCLAKLEAGVVSNHAEMRGRGLMKGKRLPPCLEEWHIALVIGRFLAEPDLSAHMQSPNFPRRPLFIEHMWPQPRFRERVLREKGKGKNGKGKGGDAIVGGYFDFEKGKGKNGKGKNGKGKDGKGKDGKGKDGKGKDGKGKDGKGKDGKGKDGKGKDGKGKWYFTAARHGT
jgi:hypothetical protein